MPYYITQENKEVEKEAKIVEGRAAKLAAREEAKKQFTSRKALSIYTTNYAESYTTPIENKKTPSRPPTAEEYVYMKRRLRTPDDVKIAYKEAPGPLFPARPRPHTSVSTTSRWDMKLLASKAHAGKYAEQTDAGTWHDTTSAIRFIGGTLPNIEVPVMSRTNSTMKGVSSF